MTKKKRSETSEVVKNPDNLPSALFENAKIDIKALIRVIRGQQVMLDRDLARLYQVDTGQLNRQVKRNLDRFPPDFMFQLSDEEFEILKCQNGISSWGGDRYLPYAFTRNGIAMLSSVLRTKTAIVSDLIRSAKERIILIDNFVDDRVLSLLDKRNGNVVATIYTRYNESFLTDLKKHNDQNREIGFIQLPQRNHDRFLIIDDIVYILEASVKDMGVGLCAITQMQTPPEAILQLLK